MKITQLLQNARDTASITLKQHIQPNYYRCHLTYFICTILITSAIFYGSNPGSNSPNGFHIRYIDALFLCTSAMTSTGLNTVNLNVANGFQQSVLFVLMLLGDLSTLSISIVVVRRWFFRRRLGELVARSKEARKLVHHIDAEKAVPLGHEHESLRRRNIISGDESNSPSEEITITSGTSSDSGSVPYPHGFGSLPAPWETILWQRSQSWISSWFGDRYNHATDHHYIAFHPQLDRRGRFRNLNRCEYDELGGVEYRALRVLCWILPFHSAFWTLLLMVILGPYATGHLPTANVIRDSQPGDTNPAWWAIFVSLAAYTNTGLNLLNANMVPFQQNWLILIVTGAGVIAGNTFYPIFLRLYIWALWKLVPKKSELHHSLSFLLHHPRRCYLWLFDKRTTLVLLATQLSLILGEWALFEILNINQTAVAALPSGTRAMDGLYQSLGTRSSGFYIVTISSFSPALQVIYMIVMYFSVFPLLISLRNTNIYSERSVGLDAEEYEEQCGTGKKRASGSGQSLTGIHIRNQLAYDLWWIALAWLLICIVEEPQLNTDAPGYDHFSVLFEVVSAYGTCGLSLGVPYDSYSLCGSFQTLSKLILIPVMLRGRHRILPLAIDRSILVPGEKLIDRIDRQFHPRLDECEELEREIREEERGSKAEDPESGQSAEEDADVEKAAQ